MTFSFRLGFIRGEIYSFYGCTKVVTVPQLTKTTSTKKSTILEEKIYNHCIIKYINNML